MDKINRYPSLKGQFLMAMPNLVDTYFSKTVTCVCEHTKLGAVGLVINKLHSALFAIDIFEELKIKYSKDIHSESIPIFIGGPVHSGEVFLIHGNPFQWINCIMINPNLAICNTRDILEAIALGRGPASYIIVLGCAGWGEGQLESEIMQNAWLTSPVSEDIIFNTPVDRRWKESLKKIGVEPLLLSNIAGHA